MRRLIEMCSRECLEMLRRHEIGRVAIATPVGPRIVPVAYSVQDGDVYFGTTPFSEVAFYGHDSDLALEVDDIDEASSRHPGACVVAIGRARAVDAHGERFHVLAADNREPWGNRRRTLYFKLHIRDVSGKRVA